MGRRTIAGGTLTSIIGFIIFQLGLLIVINRPVFLRGIFVAIFPESPSLDLVGMVFMFVGGILGVFGLLYLVKSVSNDVSRIVYAQRNETLREITNLRKSLSEMVALVSRGAITSEPSTKGACRFCGAKMDENVIFCPVCNRSQI